jgi:hypothetical protein
VNINVQVHVGGVIKAVCMYPVERNVPECYFVDIRALATVEKTALLVANGACTLVSMDRVIINVRHLAAPVLMTVIGNVTIISAPRFVEKNVTGQDVLRNAPKF